MARFSDASGGEWDLKLTVGLLPDLKRAGLDLAEAVKSGSWLGDIIFGDMERLASILWEFLRVQAEARGIDRAAFDRLIDADFMDAAANAMQEEIVGFFHRGQRKQLMAQLPKLTAKLDQELSRAMDEATTEALANLSIPSVPAGNSPASSA